MKRHNDIHDSVVHLKKGITIFEYSVVYALTASHLALKYLRVFAWLPKVMGVVSSSYQAFVFNNIISWGLGLIGSVYSRNQFVHKCLCHALWVLLRQITLMR